MAEGMIMKYLCNRFYREDIRKTIAHTIQFEYFYGKRVLVLGATGLVGSFLVDCFLLANEELGAGIEILAACRSQKSLETRFEAKQGELYYVENDLLTATPEVDSVNVIIYAVGNACPEKFRTEPVETMLVNIMGLHHVLELARKMNGCKVLYVSSGEVYGNMAHKAPVREYEYGDLNILSVRACYPNAKRAGETLCISYNKEYDTDVVIARVCHTFGANTMTADNRATAQFIDAVVKNQTVILKSNGLQERSYAYIADCAAALLTILTKGVTGEAYNVATEEVLSIYQFAERCACESKGIVRREEPDLITRQEISPIQHQILDNTKLRELGWRPAYTISEGIHRSILIKREVDV